MFEPVTTLPWKATLASSMSVRDIEGKLVKKKPLEESQIWFDLTVFLSRLSSFEMSGIK